MKDVTVKFLKNPYEFCAGRDGDPFVEIVFGVPTLFVSKHYSAEEVLIDRDNKFSGKAGNRSVAQKLFGSSVLYEDGPEHAQLRSTLDPIFGPIHKHYKARIAQLVDKYLHTEYKNKWIDAHQLFKEISLLIVCDYYTDVELDTQLLSVLAKTVNTHASGLFLFDIDGSHKEAFGQAVACRSQLERAVRESLDQRMAILLRDRLNFSDQQILDQVITFLFAGVDTMSSCMAFALESLIGHQNDLICLSRGHARKAVRNSLETYPPVYFIPRGTTEDCEIDGALVGAGWNVNVMISDLHKRYSAGEPYGSYCPFGMGKKKCPGQAFALVAMQEILYILGSKFAGSVVSGNSSNRGYVPGQHPRVPHKIINLRPK